jgi:hypothetical protein
MTIDKKINYKVQAGVKNYKPSKMVTVPKTAKSSPTHPTAKLAYITDAEKKLLIKKNLHGSLKGKPNRGPGGIPSLEGDFGSPTGGTYSGGGGGSRPDRDVSDRRDSGTGNYTNISTVDTKNQRPVSTISTDPDDIREQAARGVLPFDTMNIYTTPNMRGVAIQEPYMTLGLETQRASNIADRDNLLAMTLPKSDTGILALDAGLNLLSPIRGAMFDRNKQFFIDNVAGNYGYGYGFEDYKDYIMARQRGEVSAYGNPEMGQNAINRRSGPSGSGNDLSMVSTTVPVQNITTGDFYSGPNYGPKPGMAYSQVMPNDGFMYVYDQFGTRHQVPIGFSGGTASYDDLDPGFNFGTESNPIYAEDLE